MKAPTDVLIAWLNKDGDLLQSATRGVWKDPGPLDPREVRDDRPYVTVSLVSGLITQCGGGSEQMDALYAVKAVGTSDDIAAVRAARDRIDVLMGAPPRLLGRYDLDGFEVLGAWSEEAIELVDPEDATGVRFEHLGANYRLQVQPRTAA